MRLVVDEPLPSPLETSVRGIVTVAQAARLQVRAGGESLFFVRYPHEHRLERLVIPDDVVHYLEILDVKVGPNSQLLSVAPLAAQVFSESARGVSLRTEVASWDRPVSVRVRLAEAGIPPVILNVGVVLRSPRWRGGDHLVSFGRQMIGRNTSLVVACSLLIGGRLDRLIITGDSSRITVASVEVVRRGVRLAHFPPAGEEVMEEALDYTVSSPGKLCFTKPFYVLPGDELRMELSNFAGETVTVGGAWVVKPSKVAARRGGK